MLMFQQFSDIIFTTFLTKVKNKNECINRIRDFFEKTDPDAMPQPEYLPGICPIRYWAFGCKLMMASTAKEFLITVRIFAVTIK